MTRQADFKRRVRARMAKTGESYATARSRLLSGHQDTTPTDSSIDWMREALHVSNGDATDVPGTGLARRVIYWRDVLHEGPVPAVAPAELRRIRADYLSGQYGAEQAGTVRQLTERAIARAMARETRPFMGDTPRTFTGWTGWRPGRTHCSASIRPAAPWSWQRACT